MELDSNRQTRRIISPTLPRTFACSSCSKAKRRCENARPCQRCIKLRKASSCNAMSVSNVISHRDFSVSPPAMIGTKEASTHYHQYFTSPDKTDKILSEIVSNWCDNISPFELSDLTLKRSFQWRLLQSNIRSFTGSATAEKHRESMLLSVKSVFDKDSLEFQVLADLHSQEMLPNQPPHLRISVTCISNEDMNKFIERDGKILKTINAKGQPAMGCIAFVYKWRDPILTVAVACNKEILQTLQMGGNVLHHLMQKLPDCYLDPILWIFGEESRNDVAMMILQSALKDHSMYSRTFSLVDAQGEPRRFTGVISSHFDSPAPWFLFAFNLN